MGNPAFSVQINAGAWLEKKLLSDALWMVDIKAQV
jgi:hypothetical protein